MSVDISRNVLRNAASQAVPCRGVTSLDVQSKSLNRLDIMVRGAALILEM